MSIVIIAAIGQNNELGIDNHLIWHLPKDLKFFKEKTMGKTILMGSNTFHSLPRLLPGRKHVVLTSKKDGFPEEVILVPSLEAALSFCEKSQEDIYVIGGAKVYEQFLQYASVLYLTEVEASCDMADVYFPEFKKEDYERTILGKNDETIPFKHVQYVKKLK